MATCVPVTDIAHLASLLKTAGYGDGVVSVSPYTWDERIKWDTHIVTLDGNAVGFTNGPVGSNDKGQNL
jgi:hypothetical protein